MICPRFLSPRRPAWAALLLLTVCLGPACGGFAQAADDEEFVTAPDTRPQLTIDPGGLGESAVRAIDVSDDGRLLAAAGGAVVLVYDLPTGRLLHTIRGYREEDSGVGRVNWLAFAPGGRFLALGVKDNVPVGSTRIVDLENPHRLHALVPGQTGCSIFVEFSPDGRFLLTRGCGLKLMHPWDAETGTAAAAEEGGADGGEEADGGTGERRTLMTAEPLIAVGDDSDVASWELEKKLKGPSKAHRFSSDGRYLLDGSRAFDLTRGEFAERPEELPAGLMIGMRQFLAGAAPGYAIDEGVQHTLAAEVAPRADTPLCLRALRWDGAGAPPDGESTFRVGYWTHGSTWPARTFKIAYDATALGWNPGAGVGAAGDSLGNLYVWDLKTGERRHLLQPRSRKVWNVQWSADGSKLLLGHDHHPEGRYMWNRLGPVTHEFDLNQLRYRRTDEATVDRPFELPVRGGRLLTRKPVDETAWLALRTPAGDVRLDPWDDPGRLAGTNNVNLVLPDWFGEPMCYTAAESATGGGERLFVGSKGGYLVEGTLVADAAGQPTFRLARWFHGHGGMVTGVAVSPDGTLLASSSLDGTVRVWNLDPPRVLGDLDVKTNGTEVRSFPGGGLGYAAGLFLRERATEKADGTTRNYSEMPDAPFDPESFATSFDDKYGGRLLRFGETTFYGRMPDLIEGNYRPGDRVEVQVEQTHHPRTTKTVELAPAPDHVRPLWSLFLADPEAGSLIEGADGGEWVAWTHEGYYAASPDGGRFVGWHVNRERHELAEFLTVDQFGESLNQPRVVTETLRRRSSTEAARLVRAELDARPQPPTPIDARSAESLARTAPPEVFGVRVQLTPAEPNPEPTAALPNGAGTAVEAGNGAAAVVRFSVRQKTDRPIREAVVALGGRPAPGPTRLVDTRQEAGRPVQEYEHRFPWPRQDAELTVTAVDDAGLKHTVAQPIQGLAAPGEGDGAGGTLYLLAIGVSEYERPRFRLRFAADDANAFAEFWAGEQGRTYDKVVSRVITDAEATRAGVEDGLTWLAKQPAKEGDLTVAFLSGHGVVDEDGDWFFGTVETDPHDLLSTAVPFSRFELMFRKIDSDFVLFTDTCHAAALSAAGLGAERLPIRPEPGGVGQWAQTLAITYASCQESEASFEHPPLRHGAFTAALLERLRRARAGEGEEWLLFSDLLSSVDRRVPQLTDEKQHPTMHAPRGTRSLKLIRVGAEP